MLNRTVQAAAEGMPDDQEQAAWLAEFVTIYKALSPAAKAEIKALVRSLQAEERRASC